MAPRKRTGTLAGLGFWLLLGVPLFSSTLWVTAVGGADRAIGDYRTIRLLMHTDLPAEQVPQLLAEIEDSLACAEQYWGQPCGAPIELFLVHDSSVWQDRDLPHPLARLIVRELGGAVVPALVLAERGFRHKAVVFGQSQAQIARHEVIHAYCVQTFPQLGPNWYKEGMAEVLCYHRRDGSGIQCPESYLEVLRKSPPRRLQEIVADDIYRGEFLKTLQALQQQSCRRPQETAVQPQQDLSLLSWKNEDAAAVQSARKAYMWSWAMCNLLAMNPNYAQRFRALGNSFLNGRPDSFGQAFGPVQHQLEFELRFMIGRLATGYRVDLCAWDWQRPFHDLPLSKEAQVKVLAARGYQPTGVELKGGHSYDFLSAGNWSTGHGPSVDADGTADGQGWLEGILLANYQLGEPFRIGCRQRWTSPASGRLYVRCHDDWSGLNDNRGAVQLRIRRSPAERSPRIRR